MSVSTNRTGRPGGHSFRIHGVAVAWCLMAAAPGGGMADAPAQTLEAAVLEVRQDIERATAELNQLRAEIARERKPLAAALDTLSSQVAEQRAEAERLRRLRLEGEKAQAVLVSEAEAVEQECRFLLSVFSDYARAMETRVTVAESALLAEALRDIDARLAEGHAFEGLPGGVDELLGLAAEWNRQRVGGHVFEGAALNAQGIEIDGRFAVFGPIAYFAAEAGTPAGLAITEFGSAQPAVYDRLPEAARAAIADVVAGREATVPADVTAGDAIKVAEARTSLVDHVKKGGFVMIPLLTLGFLAAALVLWKTVELAGVRFRGDDRLRDIMARLRAGDAAGAEAAAQGMKGPLASLVQAGIAHRDASREHLEEIMHEHVLGAAPQLERHLGTLAVFGGVAPLLGLLGTVTGMIHTFQLVTVFGSGDAKLLSGGISEALVTTEFGLAIAIPVLLAHAFLARRVRTMLASLEQTAVAMVNDIKIRGAQ